MELSLRRWKPGQLLASWGVYWAGLIGVGVGPALIAGWRATRLPKGHGTIQASIDNGALSYSVVQEGVTTFSTITPFSTALLWVVGPPLLLWLLWLMVRERPNAATPAIGSPERNAGALPSGDGPADVAFRRRDEEVEVRREPSRTPNP